MRGLAGSIPFLDGRWQGKAVLLVALLNGLLYLFLVPPWQHYDEPTHFEYAWLIANRGTLPEPGDYDQGMRREVAASMVEHDFFRGMGFTPDLLAQERPVWIGVAELHHPPLYYLLVALPLRLVRFADVALQLRVARAVSLLLYVLSIWLGSRIVAELVSEGHVLRWAVPGVMALLPAYTDLMTAVNNDVGAVVMFSLFLWGAVRMIMRGFSWPRLIWVAGTAVLCVWTKNTAAVAVLLAPLAVALGAFRGLRQGWAWMGVGVVSLALTVAAVGWGDAALWYRQTDQRIPTRQERAEAPLGKTALALEMTSVEPGRSLMQPLLQADVEALHGQTVTLGAWIWASEPVKVRSPMLDDGHRTVWKPIEVGPSPAFYAITGTVAAEAEEVKVVLRPLLNRTVAQTATVWYDGIVLVEGARPPGRPPVFNGPEGRGGVWGGEPIFNRVRNGSAEAAWPRVRGWVDRALSVLERVPFKSSQLLGSVLDWERTAWVYPRVLRTLVRSFWAYFGWGHVQLAPPIYWLLEGITIGSIASTLAFGIRRWRHFPRSGRQAVTFLIITAVLVWSSALLRVHSSPLNRLRLWIPVARYAFPAIIPSSLGLVWGWLRIVPIESKQWVASGVLLFLLLLDGISMVTIVSFYA